METLLLIDANSLIHRAFHALPPLTGPAGEPIQAVYGVASILLKIWREDPPRYAAALFDRPEPTFRKELYAAYKAQRPKAPDDLVAQIEEAHRLYAAFHIPSFEEPGFEADDLIAGLAVRFGKGSGPRVVILTGDRDTLQLVEDDRIVVRALRRGVSDTVWYDEKMVQEEYGIPPRSIVDYKALMGDPSDNIAGVKGIGPKTARDLVSRYGTVEELYAAAERDAALAKKLGGSKEAAALSKKLVLLRTDDSVTPKSLVALEVSVSDARRDCAAYFSSLGFKALLARLENGNRTISPSREKNRHDAPPPQALFT